MLTFAKGWPFLHCGKMAETEEILNEIVSEVDWDKCVLYREDSYEKLRSPFDSL